jgi:UDPglucose 6-dehydrogenase
MHDIHTLSILGLGKLGIPMAACFAAKGFDVIGVDRDPTRVTAINDGVAPIHEPGLQELIDAHAARLSATRDVRDAVQRSDATFIVVPTPSTGDGTFTCRYVLEACRDVGAALRAKAGPHLVVVTSTVMPGDTAGPIRATLEEAAGKTCGEDLLLCYSPEFIALGSVVRDFLNPDMLLIGQCPGDADAAGDALEAIMRRTCDNSPAVVRMNAVNAELAKLAVNSFVTTKITFANTLARMCESLDGANVDAVTAALGHDSRIGRKYLKGATAFGGPCFPRDSVALASLGRRLGTRAVLAEATDAANRAEIRRLVELVLARLPEDGVVGVLGLAYKPHTDVCEQSAGVLLTRALIEQGVSVVAHDPAAVDHARAGLGDRVTFAGSADAAVRLADVVVIATPWPEFQQISPDALARAQRRRVVIDCWRQLDGGAVSRLADYIPVGVGRPESAKRATAPATRAA